MDTVDILDLIIGDLPHVFDFCILIFYGNFEQLDSGLHQCSGCFMNIYLETSKTKLK